MKTSKLLFLGMLVVALFMTAPAIGVHVGGSVTPNSVINDGTEVLHFTWDIYDWSGTADYYTF